MADDPTLLREVSQHDITWTFDQPMRAGQFVNGDWWVVPAEGRTQVRVVKVAPAPTSAPGGADNSSRHGSMINPQPGERQGYDDRAGEYTPDLSVTYPVDLEVDQSLVSTRSRPEDDVFNPPGTSLYGNDRSRSMLADVAILTCLADVPPADAFRPPYSGAGKPILRASAMNLSRLPSLASVEGTPSLAHYNRGMERVWLDHVTDWGGQRIRPNNHMPSYGRDMARHIGDAALLLCLGDIGDRTKLAQGMVQMGIDFYGIGNAGGGWPANGGHGHGRKLPIVLTGFLLHDPDGEGPANDLAHDMLHVGQKPRYGEPGGWRFQEDENFFFVTEADTKRALDIMQCAGTVRSVTKNSIGVTHSAKYAALRGNIVRITEGTGKDQRRTIAQTDIGRRGGDGTLTVDDPWETMPVVGESRYQVLGYQQQHIGMAEWGISHAALPKRDNPTWAAEYRALVGSSTVGFTLAARLIGLQQAWNHAPLFAYADRYMKVTDNRSLSPFANHMWRAYRAED